MPDALPEPRHSPESAHDSQQALALSIARAVRDGLPGQDSEEAIRSSVREALASEARQNEQILAITRCIIVGGILAGSLLAHLRPEILSLTVVFGWRAFLILGVWFLSAAALVLLLARRWYRPWLRRAIAVADALSIVLVIGSLNWIGARYGGGGTVGSYVAGAVSCAFLAFSGSLRLSRTSVRLTTGLGVAAWCILWAIGSLSATAGIIAGLFILGIGLLGSRLTRVSRRVITDEVTRLRLVHLYEQAQKAIDAREEVLRIVSHDLRNPLNTIAMAAEFLIEEHSKDAELTRYLGIIRRQGDGMKHLVGDLLDAARLESGRLPVSPTTTRAEVLLQSAAEMMRPLAEDHGLTLTVNLPSDMPAVHVDVYRIGQVFSNLIGNAVKFTPEGGRISLAATQIGAKIRLSVSDTGPGIPPEQLHQIFGRMWQAKKGDNRGIGLGLTIARAIVEAHGERIGVESRVGEGTEFWFTVPIAPATETFGSEFLA